MERQIQAELQHRRLNQNQKRLGSDFLNDLKLPSVVDNKPNDLSSVNSRGQNVIERQRENINKVHAREKNEQKRLLSRHKNRVSDAERASQGNRGYDQYHSNAYQGSETASKHAYSVDTRNSAKGGHLSAAHRY